MPASVAHLGLYVASSYDFVPVFPVGIIAGIVSHSRRRSEFGGWLLFFYWQICSAAVYTVIVFHRNFQAYVPENFPTHASAHRWFIIAAVSTGGILALQLAVGAMLIVVRSWDIVQLLRILLAAQTVAGLAAIVVDASYFPNYVAYRAGGLISEVIWLAYFCMSARVRHVFKFHDWEAAVETIYPAERSLSIY